MNRGSNRTRRIPNGARTSVRKIALKAQQE